MIVLASLVNTKFLLLLFSTFFVFFFNSIFADTAVSEIEEAFRSFLSRPDIAIIMINQNVSMVKHVNQMCS